MAQRQTAGSSIWRLKYQVRIHQTNGASRFLMKNIELAPQFAALNDDVLFGEVWAREAELSSRDRSLGDIPVIERNFGGGRVVL